MRCGLLPPTRYDFYPRPPRGGRPGQRHCADHLQNFYPRPPRGGRPSTITAMRTAVKFLSTPSARRATPDSAGDHPDQRFLSTPSARRATRSRGSLQRFRIFLSTPSARRATSQAYFSFRRCIISIHALREEGDVTDLGQIKLPYRISIHALREEGDPLPCCRGFMLPDFYPRPPRGGRRARWNPLVLIPVFLSTPSARRATAIDVSGQIGRQISIHALREEGDQEQLLAEINRRRFLSTPSARRATSAANTPAATSAFLSTPSARRATARQGQSCGRTQISIHALREEGDSSSCAASTPSTNFYPRPPRGGRRVM